VDQVAEIYQQTGLRPDIIRALLDGRALTEREAQMMATRFGMSAQEFVGEPLHSVLHAVCATGKLTLGPKAEGADVPFAFASLLAGVGGFMLLLSDLANPEAPSIGWSQHCFKPTSAEALRRLATQSACVRCKETAALNGDQIAGEFLLQRRKSKC
jgi:hypothetical protein